MLQAVPGRSGPPMSENTLHDAARLGSAAGADDAREADRPLVTLRSLTAPASALSFWLAIALPALYLPLLFAGLSSTSDLVTFLALFGLHLAALVGGRSYRRG